MWKIFGSNRARSGSSDGEQGPSEGNTAPSPTFFRSFPSSGSNASDTPTRSSGETGFMGFSMGGGANRQNDSRNDARLERAVTLASRQLGDGVQEIVLAAKAAKEPSNTTWKEELLDLLGENTSKFKKDKQKGKEASEPSGADIDTLIASSTCTSFVTRCVENDLPPNLIHCLRLLRVLELQHASDEAAAAAEKVEGGAENQDASAPIKPAGARATRKVARLLCMLCKDQVVGEQLKPHLLGLLSLSGASYPPSALHVAKAASDVIIAYSEHCLSTSLVGFIHDRKMVIHMTDDVKDLAELLTEEEIEAAGPSSVPMGLVGAEAEKQGLWAIALRTIVTLVACSCRHGTSDLLHDFEAAGGYEVLQAAIRKSTKPFGKELIELLPQLACCSNEVMTEDEFKLAVNIRVFEIQEDLLVRSNPLLSEYARLHENGRPDITSPEGLQQIASLSLQRAVQLRATTKKEKNTEQPDNLIQFDVASELLSATLQLFSDHSRNYEILEGRQHILSFYLLALPCFDDESLKTFILKTLEFVLTGVGVADEVTPVHSTVEIFFALCHAMLRGKDGISVEATEEEKEQALVLLGEDASLMCNTLEKLLQFDQRVAPIMVESGILTTSLDSLLDLTVAEFSSRTSEKEAPANESPLDMTYDNVCRVLKLLVSHQPVNFNQVEGEEAGQEATNLHRLLRIAVQDLGVEAARAAAGVFEAYMASFASLDGLNNDMKFVLRILDHLAGLVEQTKSPDLRIGIIDRQAILVSMVRAVLEARGLSRESFCKCGGFEKILSLLLPWRDRLAEDDADEGVINSMVNFLQASVSILDAAIGIKSRNPISTDEASTLVMAPDVLVDPFSSRVSSRSPAASNRNIIRERAFYLDLAAAMAGTGILSTDRASAVLDLALAHVDPSLVGSNSGSRVVRNPDAIRLVLGLALFVPKSSIAESALDEILSLCEPDKVASTLPQIASCGIGCSLTNPKEFGPVLTNREHLHHDRFVQLMVRLSSHRMSYSDFIGLLRCMAGPILTVGNPSDGRVRLPVISASIKKRSASSLMNSDDWRDEFARREDEICQKLEYVCNIAKNSEAAARIRLGGDTINSIAVLMHKVRLADRLRAVAEEGRLKYLEIEKIDSSALSPEGSGEITTPDTGTNEGVWAPLGSTGFTYSMWLRHDIAAGSAGNLYILDLSSPPTGAEQEAPVFLSVWYDLQNQRFNVMSSASSRSEPICFPVSPLLPEIWHHVLLTYAPAKRTMMARKSVVTIYVDGRPLEAEVKVDAVSLPPNARIVVGAPNPSLAVSGIVRGVMPVWELGPILLLSTILLDFDAAAVYCYGPAFPGLLWGDRPQRLSLAATATATFSMLAGTGELGSLASALRRRDIAKLERAGYSSLGHNKKDDLSTMSLLCRIPPECVVFGFQPSSTTCKLRNAARRLASERLVNLAKLSFSNDAVSTDAVVYGRDSVVTPLSFSDNLQWAGGPAILMPLVNAANSSKSLALTLELIREGSRCHRPNLQMLQAGGGYRVLGVLLQEKPAVDESCLDQCLAFAVHGFTPGQDGPNTVDPMNKSSSRWVLTDLDAMKHLLLNHKVWDLRKYGPEVPLRLLWALNRLVDHRSIHKAFNARRLHQVGIVRWTLHLMIEACELYMGGDQNGTRSTDNRGGSPWSCESPLVTDVVVGGDPGNPFLLECKNLLRRVLTFMLTPGDLGALAEASIFTVAITSTGSKPASDISPMKDDAGMKNDERMLPSSTMRLHLVRLLEELIVDGVNEIVASHSLMAAKQDKNSQRDTVFQPHSGGVASPGQPYFSSSVKRGIMSDGNPHPKHQQAQAFLSAFAGFLTPVWFATLLEGTREEASAAATLRLMILLLQGSAAFEHAFGNAGGFTPFVLSVPRYSTSPGLAIAMLSQLLHVPILHLHALPSLDPEMLCELFDAEGDEVEEMSEDVADDPSSGIFALIAECVGRNIKIIASRSESLSVRAAGTNQAIFHLLCHRFDLSGPFREFCRTKSFIVPLSQTLCSAIDDRSQQSRLARSRRRSALADVPKGLTPTERYIGGPNDPDSGGMGLVRLLRRFVMGEVKNGPSAALAVRTIFHSFPIHATPQQVEAFHLILLEHSCKVIDKVMEEGGVTAVANCVGICSVLLEQMIQGFLTPEAALDAVHAITNILNKLVKFETSAVHSLANAEHSFLTMDAAHLANLTSAAALRVSLAGVHPQDNFDRGDEDLQSEVLNVIDSNIDSLLLLPSNDRRRSRKIPTGKFPRPVPGTKLYPLWQSSSVARYLSAREISYPDLSTCERPDIATFGPLLVVLQRLLLGEREDVRSLAISVLIAFLKHRPNLMSELLVAEIQKGEQSEKIDVVNRGGFRALLAAHEAASAADGSGSPVSVQRKYSSFFEWFERNRGQVQIVFDSVHARSIELFPTVNLAYTLQSEAVEEEQKQMLLRLTQEESDRTIIGGLERAELCRRCNERTAENHFRWKRQGFDDLAYGAMKLKTLMRRLKGSFSIWEGGPRLIERSFSLEDRLKFLGAVKSADAGESIELVKRWKLDLTEGYERQRRRLLPNYEFHGLYNLDENAENDADNQGETEEKGNSTENDGNEVVDVEVEATAALLKDLNLKRAHKTDDELGLDEFEDADDGLTVATTATGVSSVDGTSLVGPEDSSPIATGQSNAAREGKEQKDEDNPEAEADTATGNEDSYELVTGLLQKGDWPLKSYNVRRCTGLEVTKALFLFCQEAVYVIDGFEQTDGDKITRVEREQSTFYVSLRPKGFKIENEKSDAELTTEASDEKGNLKNRRESTKSNKAQQSDLTSEVIHQHRSQRIEFSELSAVYRRRYQLQQSGLEFFDINKNATLIAFDCNADREEVLSKVLNSNLHPDSIFNVYGSSISFAKTMGNLKARITSQWVNGKMSNFDFLMQINNLAGRSFNDLTQYPVFPWIIADYDSEELDLDDPKTYRDLSKPMGALGEERAHQFRERYEALESTYFGEDDPPPFHYGTHYSSAAYTLYYLMRLEPFSRLALALQGGRFDVADRLFHDIGRSWKSASSENLQDVRELIPEFFFLPDFLVNTNGFDFGETQRGKTVHDVSLPKWAKGDPKRFIRINRQALESPYVSQHLHRWVDLVFGFKQRSVEDLNVFVHVTYEGEVDLESMTDPIQRASTIAQIQNFGQTPSRIERKPFPQRTAAILLKDQALDFGALPYLSPLTPPLCVAGAPHRVKLTVTQTDTCKLGLTGQTDRSIGDLCLFKGQAIGVGRMCSFIVNPKKYIRFGGLNNGISVHTAARHRDVNTLLTMHDGLHRSPISVAKASMRGDWIVTGCVDSTIRVWKYDKEKLKCCASLCGHEGFPIRCLDISTEFSIIVSGSDNGRVLVWDMRTLTFVRRLQHDNSFHTASSVSVNNRNGNICTLVGSTVSLFDINGNLLARQEHFASPPTCAVASDCPEWMEEGVVVVTGHMGGEVCLWSLDYSKDELVMRYKLEGNPHASPITSLRVCGPDRQDHLLVGDSTGKMSVCKVVQLENMETEELSRIAAELTEKT